MGVGVDSLSSSETSLSSFLGLAGDGAFVLLAEGDGAFVLGTSLIVGEGAFVLLSGSGVVTPFTLSGVGAFVLLIVSGVGAFVLLILGAFLSVGAFVPLLAPFGAESFGLLVCLVFSWSLIGTVSDLDFFINSVLAGALVLFVSEVSFLSTPAKIKKEEVQIIRNRFVQTNIWRSL